MVRHVNNFRIVFSVCVTIVFAYGIYEALSYAYLAKIFPLYISLVMFILSGVNLIQEIYRLAGGTQGAGAGRADLGSQWDIPMAEVWRRVMLYLGFMLILYFGIWFIGYPLSITFFIILFYRYTAKTGWVVALMAGSAGMGFLALVSKVLTMDWPEGLITLPWPLG